MGRNLQYLFPGVEYSRLFLVFGSLLARYLRGANQMANGVGGTVAISAYNPLKADDFLQGKPRRSGFWRVDRWQRVREFCADCRAIVTYWLYGGSIRVDFRSDCLIISGRPKG
jgi:hypothetical protein